MVDKLPHAQHLKLLDFNIKNKLIENFSINLLQEACIMILILYFTNYFWHKKQFKKLSEFFHHNIVVQEQGLPKIIITTFSQLFKT